MQDLIPQESLSDLLPEQLLSVPTSKDEPSLDDLDQLLAESMAAVKKAPNRRVLKETKKNVDDLLEEFKLIRWDVLENISVWQMTHCKCGQLGVLTFVRNMQKLQKVGRPTELHWETVKELPAGEEVKYALVERDVEKCEYCAKLEIEKFIPFGEVVR